MARDIKLPAIPDVPNGIDPALYDLLAAMKEIIEIGEGRATERDRVVRNKDLDSVLVSYSPSVTASGGTVSGAVPQAPTNLQVQNRVFSNKLTWTEPTDYKDLINHYEVWCSVGEQSRSAAFLLGGATKGTESFDHNAISTTATYYYWIRAVSHAGKYSTWEPPDQQGGYVVPPAYETVNQMLDALTDESGKYASQFDIVADSFRVIQPISSVSPWDDERTYPMGEIVSYSGAYWSSSADGNINHIPQAGSFWGAVDPASLDSAKPVFQIGTIAGLPAIGVRGNMIVDGTIKADALDAGIVSADKMMAHDVFSWTVQSGNYSTGVSGFKIDCDPTSPTYGNAEFNDFTMTINYNGNINGIPVSLADINSEEWVKLNTGLESWVITNYVDVVTYATDIAALQDQLDGQVEIWFGDVVPSSAAAPESTWLDPDTRTLHLGDLYYDRVGGLAYRYALDGTTYVWDVTNDSTAQALSLAQDAFDLADGKRRVFVVQPTPPYDAGDLWRKTADEIWACTVGRETGSYTASDWTLASTAGAPAGTTVGGVAVSTLVTQSLLSKAELLFAESFDAYDLVPDLSSRWTVGFATSTLSRVTGLSGVGYALRSLDDVGGLGVSIDKAITPTPCVIFTCRFKYQSIGGTSAAFYSGIPLLSGDLGTTFTLAVTAGALKYRNSVGADITIASCAVNVVHDLMLQVNCLAGEATVVMDGVVYGPYPLMVASTVLNLVRIRSYLSNQEDYILDDVAIYAGDVSLADLVATAQSTANTAVTASTAANLALNDIADEDMLTPVEKPPIIQQHAVFVAEQSGIDAQATAFGITTEKTSYDSAMSALVAYLATLTTPVLWSNTSGNTTIVRATFIATFTAVYTTRQALLDAINAKAKVLADAAQATGNTAQLTADGKNTVFVQVDVPTANQINDQWIDLGSNNRIQHSDALDNPYWVVNSGVTIVPDAAANYAGEVTADKLQETAIDAYHYITNPVFSYTTGKFYLHSVDVKADGRNYARLAMVAGAFGTLRRVSYNLTTGVAGSINGVPEYYTSRDLGNGWWRICIGHTASITAVTHGALVYSEITLGNASYLGDGVSGILLARQTVTELDSLTEAETHWQAQYIPTTTAPVDNTGYNLLHRWTGTAWESVQDTAILRAQFAADTAQAAADAAQIDATAANNILIDIADEDLLTPVEKPAAIQLRDQLTAEQAGIDAQATAYSIVTEKAAYDTSITSLIAYLATLTAPVLWSVTTGNTIIVRSEFLTAFNAVYATRQALLNKIYDKTKILVTAAQTTADDAALAAAAAALVASTAQDAAIAAQDAADDALFSLAEIVSNDLLTIDEKPRVIRDRDVLVAEQAGIDAQAVIYGITTEKTAYDTVVTALTTYLATLTTPTLWSSLLGNTVIVGSTFQAKFADVYAARQTLLNKIYAVTKTLVDAAALTAVWSSVSGEDKPENGADVTATHTANDTTHVAGTLAETVASNAADAMTAVTNMSADGWLSAQEKALWRVQWPGEEGNFDSVITQATAYGLSADAAVVALQASRDALYSYLSTTLLVWSAPTVATAISPDTQLRDYVEDYYTKLGVAVNVLITGATAVNLGMSPTDVAAWAYDPASRINNQTTTIQGGKITTGTVLAAQLGAGQVFANHVGTNEIIANVANLKNAIVTGAKIAIATIANANMGIASIGEANIIDANVTTLKIAGNAATIPVAAFTEANLSLTSGVLTTVQTCSITTGFDVPVSIVGSSRVGSSGAIVGTIYLYRGASLLYSAAFYFPNLVYGGSGILTFSLTDSPGPNATAYYLKIYTSSAGVQAGSRSLTLIGCKR